MKNTTKNLICRNGNYQFFIKIPTSILHHFEGKSRIQKSLRTSSESEAIQKLALIREKVKSNFMMLQSGLLSDEQRQAVVADLIDTQTKKKTKIDKPKNLAEIVKLYVEEKTPDWKNRTKLDNEVMFKRIAPILGNKNIGEYKRSDVVELRNIFLREGLSERTCNKHIGLLSTLLRWTVRHLYTQYNFAEGLILDIPRRKDLERKRFDLKDIQEIIDNIPLKHGDETQIWIPLIALYSGMRREEICQLRRSDIRQENEVWIFNINDGVDQSLKTEASSRFVPIHSVILELGFIDFCNQRAIGKDVGNLWGFARWRESWGKSWGGWFNRWYSECIQHERGKCFHSFRHTMTDELKQAGEQRELVAELLGHVVNDMTFGRYGKRYSVVYLKNAIERITLRPDLSRFRALMELACKTD